MARCEGECFAVHVPDRSGLCCADCDGIGQRRHPTPPPPSRDPGVAMGGGPFAWCLVAVFVVEGVWLLVRLATP